MKTKALSLFILIVSLQASHAASKLKLGIRMSPAISFAGIRDKNNDDGITFSANGVSGRAILGPMAEFFLTDNVSFGTGLWYSPRNASFSAKIKALDKTFNYSINSQYLMLPVYFKFYTNPITSKMKLYFTLGATADIKIFEKRVDDEEASLGAGSPYFSYVDASLMLGAGVEFALNESSAFFVGVGYNRGLSNVINPIKNKESYNAFSIRQNLVSLDLGFKF